jgi:hypothetical protein
MSFKRSIEAIKKIEQETAMKNRGGFAFLADGGEERLAFFGDKDHVEKCLSAVATILLKDISKATTDKKEEKAASFLRIDLLENLEFMNSVKKEKGITIPLPMRNEFSFSDRFEEIAMYIAKNARPQKEQDTFIFAMMNGEKMCLSTRDMIWSDSLCDKIRKGDKEAEKSAINNLYTALLGIIGNYFAMHTDCTEETINEFFEKYMKNEKSFVLTGIGRKDGVEHVMPPYNPIYPDTPVQ